MIRNLIFDFGKVLVDYDFDLFFGKHIPDPKRRRVVSAFLNNEQLQTLLDKEDRHFDLTMQDVIDQHKEYEAEIRIFCDLYTDIVTGEVPGMREVLASYKAKGYRLYGLTNWCHKVHQTMAQYPIFSLLDGVVISSEEKLIKPDPAIYNTLFQRYSLKPEECIFTDDREENILAGKALGMDGIVFHSTQQYLQELEGKIG